MDTKLIILDRDGVINEEFPNQYILHPEQFVLISQSLPAIVALKQAGYIVVVATNQSIIAKQMINFQDLAKIHHKLQNLLHIYNVQIDKFFICPHQVTDKCICRKPKPGMLLAIAKEYNFDFKAAKIHFVGDSSSDILAAEAVGAIPVLVKTGKGGKTINDPSISNISNLLIFENLYSVVNYLINQ